MTKTKWLGRLWPVALLILALIVSACGSTSDTPQIVVPGGDPLRGQGALLGYGCESCHIIPGVTGTSATVGPPLAHFALRRFVAGQLQNTPDNVIKWIMDPQSVEPGTAMPDLHVSEAAARDIAAYLYTLR